jgi:acyl carrier protein
MIAGQAPGSSELESRVIQVVAAALDRNPSDIQRYSSLIDDLGAESIDFLDIRFRLETEFHIKISDQELWEGTLRKEYPQLVTDRGVTDEGIQLLKEHMPEFQWDRFQTGVSLMQLPRLITVSTIVDYLGRRLACEALPETT